MIDFKRKWLLGRAIDMWPNWRDLWDLAPRDEEVSSGDIEERERERETQSSREESLICVHKLWVLLSLGVKPFWLYKIVLYNILAWSYFIHTMCEDWSCRVDVYGELIKSNCFFPGWEEPRKFVSSSFCERSTLSVVWFNCERLSINQVECEILMG